MNKYLGFLFLSLLIASLVARSQEAKKTEGTQLKNQLDMMVDCDLSYLTTIENFDVFVHNPSGAILYRAKMAIDADGCPRAYGPNDSGLDWTANAGYPGNWWGIVTDANGDPIIQGPTDPYPGMYVSSTSLVQLGYSDSNPLRYVDSENIPYIALPSSLQSLANIAKGDLAFVRNSTNGNTSFAYFADTGPSGKLGEGSMYLAVQLGINSSPRTGGTSQGIIDYVVFPQSGYGQGHHLTREEIDSIGQIYLDLAGGAELPGCLDAPAPSLDCSNAVELSCGVTFNGTASTAPSVIGTYGCNTWTETGPERVHTVVAGADGSITATITNFTGDLDVYILGSCDPMDCLGTVSSSSATYDYAVGGETYYIVVDADDGSGSAYDLLVTCQEPVPDEDVFITNESVFPTAIYPGDTILTGADVHYSGVFAQSQLPALVLAYFLSPDCILDSADIFLGIDTALVGTDFPYVYKSTEVVIPDTTAPGQYNVLFVADYNDAFAEADEGNNISCISITVESSVGFESVYSEHSFRVFPNPSEGTFNIEFNPGQSQFYSVEVVDIQGRMVMKKDFDNTGVCNFKAIDLSKEPKGMYLLKVKGSMGSEVAVIKLK